MKIFIFGPHGSGKSTWIENHLTEYHGYDILKIDDYRQQYHDGTWKGVNMANHDFISSIDLNKRNQIIECTGVGRVGEMIRAILPKIQDDIRIVIIKVDFDTQMQRLRDRKDKRQYIPAEPTHEFDYEEYKKYKLLHNWMEIVWI